VQTLQVNLTFVARITRFIGRRTIRATTKHAHTLRFPVSPERVQLVMAPCCRAATGTLASQNQRKQYKNSTAMQSKPAIIQRKHCYYAMALLRNDSRCR